MRVRLSRALVAPAVVAAALCAAPDARAFQPAPAAPTAEQAAPAALVWETDWSKAVRRSCATNRPLLALSSLPQCPYCRTFAATLAAPAVTQALQNYVLFRFDLREQEAVTRRLGVYRAPAVVVMAPNGARLAELEGAAGVTEFVAWLAEVQKKTAVLLDPAALQKDPQRAVALLANQDPLLREAAVDALAAITRNNASPDTVRAVLDAFEAGKLAQRIGALELLRLWEAPVEGIDPWKPETVPPAVKRLRAWAEKTPVGALALKLSPAETDLELRAWMDSEDPVIQRPAYERLARVGVSLLPEVRRLTPPVEGLRRERLTALRYRLLMPPAAAAAMPQIPFLMAERDPATRMHAIDTLARAARIEGNAADLEGFFLDAFGDSDPKVREAALRGLRETGAGLAKEHVVKLLADPSPNVRAGILNDLTRAPLREMAAELAAYSQKETDEDLVVHAARALRAMRNKPVCMEALLKLFNHPSWRVRAEAIEAVSGGENMWRFGVGSGGEMQSTGKDGLERETVKALTHALKDDDAFVASKAVAAIGAMDSVDVADCLRDLVAIVDRHPELAVPVIETIARNQTLRKKAAPPIRKLCAHPNAQVRAAALHTLVVCTRIACADELLDGLSDRDAKVRAAAAQSLCEWVQQSQSEFSDDSQKRRPSASTVRDILNAIPEATRAEFSVALRKGIAAEDADERFSALKALALLGDTDVAFPGLLEMIAKDPDRVDGVTWLMRLLDWDKRKQLFEALRGMPIKNHDWGQAMGAAFRDAPDSAESYLWEVFAKDPHVLTSPYYVLSAIVSYYHLPGDMWDANQSGDAGAVARLAQHVREVLAEPTGDRRALALILLCRVQRKEGLVEARRLADLPGAPDDGNALLRKVATQILLIAGETEDKALAARAMSSGDADLRGIALKVFLATVMSRYHSASIRIGEETIWVSFLTSRRDRSSISARNKPWTPPTLPDALTVDFLKPFLQDKDPETRSGAAYLLALRGDSSGLPILIEAWRNGGSDSDRVLTLARAFSALNDDRNTRYLREMYAGIDADQKNWVGGEFYWTIRRMQGTEVEQLRRNIRKELGASLMQ